MLYEWNHEGEALGEALIEANHPHLVKTKIAYLFKHRPEPKPGRKPPRAGKKQVWGKASLVPAKYEELLQASYKFVIEFDSWIWSMLTLAQQKALVDHELCHCGNDADGVYMKAHDVEEFRDIINRHGFWKDDVRLFAESCAPLFDGLPAAEKEEEAPRSAESTVTLEVPGQGSMTMTNTEFKRAVKKLGRAGVAGRPRRSNPRI